MRRPEPRLRLREALALGALHGPAELLPISSSGHTELVPWLAGWEYTALDDELRKAFGVALHAGTAAALLIALRGDVGEAIEGLDARRLALLAGSFLPPAATGYALERPIERLVAPRAIALGLAAGAVAMAWADARGGAGRAREEAGLGDGFLLGLAQACALVPGVSRNGATLTVARARGFGRADAAVLSQHVALPVITGAAVLKGVRLARRGLPPGAGRGFAGGIAASFASTLAAARLGVGTAGGGPRTLAPYAAYRVALAAVVLSRDGRGRRGGPGRGGSGRRA
jgi:undecaprenyl-diphosphatase